jgi:hypothetical protein
MLEFHCLVVPQEVGPLRGDQVFKELMTLSREWAPSYGLVE